MLVYAKYVYKDVDGHYYSVYKNYKDIWVAVDVGFIENPVHPGFCHLLSDLQEIQVQMALGSIPTPMDLSIGSTYVPSKVVQVWVPSD